MRNRFVALLLGVVAMALRLAHDSDATDHGD
jgi:hypothetical protein